MPKAKAKDESRDVLLGLTLNLLQAIVYRQWPVAGRVAETIVAEIRNNYAPELPKDPRDIGPQK